MPKPSPTRYRTTNWAAYNASLRKRGPLSVWFDPDMAWQAERSGKRWRPETFSNAAIQTVGLVESLIRMAGLDWPVPFVGRAVHRKAR